VGEVGREICGDPAKCGGGGRGANFYKSVRKVADREKKGRFERPKGDHGGFWGISGWRNGRRKR